MLENDYVIFREISLLLLRDSKVLTSSGSCSVRDRARARHNTSWSTDKPDQEEAPLLALPYDCSLARSLAYSPCVLLLFFTATTHASGSGTKKRPCMLSTKRYFGLDKDGEAETPKDGRLADTVKKKTHIFPLTLTWVFLLYLKEKFTTFVQSVTHAVYSIDLFRHWWIYGVDYRGTKRKFTQRVEN